MRPHQTAALRSIPTGIALLLIRGYQRFVSPLLAVLFRSAGCRFHPSCSEYCALAVSRYGLFRGARMSGRRLLRCHPFHPGGFDPPELRS